LNNLAEYAFGRDPRLGDAASLATPSIVASAGVNHLSIVLTRRHLALDLSYAVETAAHPAGPWAEDIWEEFAVTPQGDSAEQVTLRRALAPGASYGFFRIRATKP
jgi:hypothetical protein